MPTIRKFDNTDIDYQAIASLFEAIFGNNHHQPEDIQLLDEILGAEIPFARFVAEKDGQVIAEGSYGQSIWFGSTNKLNLNIAVHPEANGASLCDEMYAHLVKEASRHDPDAFSVRVIEDEDAEMRFWAQRGFQQVTREPRFALELTKFDLTRFEPVIENEKKQDLSIRSLADQKSYDPDWLRKWW